MVECVFVLLYHRSQPVSVVMEHDGEDSDAAHSGGFLSCHCLYVLRGGERERGGEHGGGTSPSPPSWSIYYGQLRLLILISDQAISPLSRHSRLVSSASSACGDCTGETGYQGQGDNTGSVYRPARRACVAWRQSYKAATKPCV